MLLKYAFCMNRPRIPCESRMSNLIALAHINECLPQNNARAAFSTVNDSVCASFVNRWKYFFFDNVQVEQ